MGRKPKQAASKVLTQITNQLRTSGVDYVNRSIKFNITETTRNSKKKTYYYIGQKIELQKPVEVKIKRGNGNVETIT